MKSNRLATLAASLFLASSIYGATPVYHHSFDSETDCSGSIKGSLCSGATLQKIGKEGILDLGTAGGYFDLGAETGKIFGSLSGDYSIAVNLFIPEETTLGQNGNFIFSFAHSSANGYAFFGANESRFSITLTNWTGEQTVNAGMRFPKGKWTNAVITRKGDTASVYIDGELKSSASVGLRPSELGATGSNWLGRSPYDGDVPLAGAKYADFAIYNTALSEADAATLADDPSLKELNDQIYYRQLDDALDIRNFDFSNIRSDIHLPANLGNGVTAVWSSGDPSVITNDGKVSRPAIGKPDARLTLTVEVTKGSISKKREYPAIVMAQITDEEAVAYDLGLIVLRGNLSNLRSDLSLPSSTTEGSRIKWESADPVFLSDAGKLLKLAEGPVTHEVTMTATASRGDASATREFRVNVGTKDNFDSYLFIYFPSNEDENLYYALSRDGFNYIPLNGGKRVMDSETVAIKKGIRDPHILRGEDGYFYMVATDMKSSEGWNSNRGIVMYRSSDLITWEHHTVNFPDRFPEWKNVTRVWAPEVIWDPEYDNPNGSKGGYMVYFSLYTTDGKCPHDKIFYSYANDDFSGLATDPVYLYDRGSATIDGDIIHDESTGLYHLFYKNEGSGGICKVTASRLTALPGEKEGSQWGSPSRPLQQTWQAVEGAGVFKMINSDTWILMYDCYLDGHYQFCASEDLENFTLRAETATSGAFTPRHGAVIPLTPEETARLLEKFPPEGQVLSISASASPLTRTDNFKVSGQDVYVPVRPGADLKHFDPMLMPSLGATISPEGPQDFTSPVKYTVRKGRTSKEFTVTAAIEANPVLPGFTADPEILYSEKTGRFYLYPTSDGLPGWGGYKFNVYSSADLVNWQRDECILDLSGNDVTWADGNAWAPSIEEKIIDGKYRYFFYFSGNNPSLNRKTLGCAIADNPTGPFHDLGYPMIETNVADGQLIDSDVFTDPVSGQTYFYWGNGSLVASRLGEDMTTILEPAVITPKGGTLSDYAFREGVYVFYREGKYYFLWSVDDTGARNYHVAYGTSDSPMGPIKVASSPIVIREDAANYIYGTGHNSIVKIPGRDEWYIVYHRINRKFVNNDPGTHREVCIDRLEFNNDGSIKPVTPTHKGIAPVNTGNNPDDSGIQTVTSPEGEVTETVCYDLTGRRINDHDNARGLYIRIDRYANGVTRACKVIK